MVIPAVGEGLAMPLIEQVTQNYRTEYKSLTDMLGASPGSLGAVISTGIDERHMSDWFEKRFGRKPIPIEDLING